MVFLAVQAQPAAIAGPLGLRQGDLRQDGKRVEFTVDTARPVAIGELSPNPDVGDGASRYLCLELTAASGHGARVCPGPGNRVGITPIGSQPGKPARADAEVLQPSAGRTTVRFSFGALELDPGPYRFRFISSDGSCGKDPGPGCTDAIPSGNGPSFNLRVPALTGCENAGGGREVRYGPRDRKAVALTFDDGPGVSTGDVLRILRRKHARGTFFLQSKMLSQDPDAVRRIAREGNEVGNHSIAHDALPPQSDIEEANRAIAAASGVSPCAFRPPYGVVDQALVNRARAVGLDTVLWDVDTDDWQSATTVDSILANVKATAGNGSIILMHDGGDQPRTKTLELLPRLVDLLRGEGYELVTVSELLGNRITWQPLGNP